MLAKIRTLFKSVFFKDVAISTIGQVVILLLTLIINKILSIKYGPEIYTEFNIIYKTATILAYAMILSMGIMLPKYLAIYNDSGDRLKEYNLFRSAFILLIVNIVILAFLTFFFRNIISEKIYGSTEFISNVVLSILLASQISFYTFLFSYYRGVNNFFLFSASQVLLSILILVTVTTTEDMDSMLLVRSSLGFIAIVWLFNIIKRYNLPRPSINDTCNQIKFLVKTGSPRIPGEIILFSYATVPLIIISNRIGLEESAAFTISFGIISAVSPLFRYIGLVLLPYSSRELSNNNISAVERKIRYLGYAYLAFALMASIFIYFFPNFVISLLYSHEYLKFAQIVKITIISVIPYSLYLLLRNPIDAISDMPFNTINLAISFIVTCIAIVKSSSLIYYAFSIVLGYSLLGFLSLGTWNYLIKRKTYEKKSKS